MLLTRVGVGVVMTARMLRRNRLALLLLVLIPVLFLGFILVTTAERRVPIELPAAGAGALRDVSQRAEGVVFVSLAAVGVLTAFLSLDLLQRDAEVTRRLVQCGYHPWEVIATRLVVLAGVIVAVATLNTAVVASVFAPAHTLRVWAGFLLGGYVYGGYGLLVGALVRRELEGILCVALLANMDVGWVQNPIYYAGAQHKEVIRALPAYWPSQVSMLGAFTDEPVGRAALWALAYGAALLLLALLAFGMRVRATAR